LLINSNYNITSPKGTTEIQLRPASSLKSEEDAELISVDPEHPERTLKIGTGLSAEEKVQFVKVLIENIDVFAWCPTDMPGIDPEVIVHRLKVDSAALPVKQKPH